MANKHSEENQLIETTVIEAAEYISEKFEENWKSRGFKARKISAKDSKELDGAIRCVMEVVNYINSQPEGTEFILGRHINDFVIMNITAPLIVKNSIRYIVSNRLTVDLAVRHQKFECSRTYLEYLEAIAIIRRYQKKEASEDTTTLGSLRVDVSLADVIDKAAIIDFEKDGDITYFVLKVKYNSETYVPVAINPVINGLFKSSYFNSTVEEILEDHFVNVQL